MPKPLLMYAELDIFDTGAKNWPYRPGGSWCVFYFWFDVVGLLVGWVIGWLI